MRTGSGCLLAFLSMTRGRGRFLGDRGQLLRETRDGSGGRQGTVLCLLFSGEETKNRPLSPSRTVPFLLVPCLPPLVFGKYRNLRYTIGHERIFRNHRSGHYCLSPSERSADRRGLACIHSQRSKGLRAAYDRPELFGCSALRRSADCGRKH